MLDSVDGKNGFAGCICGVGVGTSKRKRGGWNVTPNIVVASLGEEVGGVKTKRCIVS